MNLCGGLAFSSVQSEGGIPGSAADAVPLPQPEPRAMREHFVMPSICSGEVTWAQRSKVWHREDSLEAFDFGNSLLGVHSVPISDIGMPIVKRRSIGMSCQLARHSSLLCNTPFRNEINSKASQPMPAFVMLACHSRQTSPPVCLGSRHDRRQALVVLR